MRRTLLPSLGIVSRSSIPSSTIIECDHGRESNSPPRQAAQQVRLFPLSARYTQNEKHQPTQLLWQTVDQVPIKSRLLCGLKQSSSQAQHCARASPRMTSTQAWERHQWRWQEVDLPMPEAVLYRAAEHFNQGNETDTGRSVTRHTTSSCRVWCIKVSLASVYSCLLRSPIFLRGQKGRNRSTMMRRT